MVNRAQELLELTKRVVISLPGRYINTFETADKDKVFIFRVREDLTVYSGLNLCTVSDNLVKERS
ncbi:MAG: hypothetical protein EBQ62_03865 [Alphaproteobacteria bacterium]|nr:hypothetical protein [Alphaproteobacteria bacterium]